MLKFAKYDISACEVFYTDKLIFGFVNLKFASISSLCLGPSSQDTCW